ncbi:IS5 family transposase [Gimesia aquarii]|uniref:Transposase DDE domain protein n=1 Tax=Gimesia aquarii TaxID=2527964 RepID=A0A517WY01_9PLAN|nr:IS5 family transposase [Gimesia aquarii]QDU10128.1 Transposase DDE domain protein [Gimesia aquarii]
MSRHDLTNTEWNAIRNSLPKERSGKPGRPWADHRKTINGIMWLLNVGAPWRDIPECYGKWQTIYKRFRSQSGFWHHLWSKLLQTLRRNKMIDPSIWCVDGSIVRAHHSAVGGSSQTSRCAVKNGLGRSRGGYSSKLHIARDGQGIPLGIRVTAGQINEPTEFIDLMDSIPLKLQRKANRSEYLAGDKAYVARYIFEWLESKSIGNVIPNRKNENKNPNFCRERYRQRNVVERLIGRLKHFRRIATRYDKTVESYLSMIKIAFLRITIKAIK